MVQLGSFELMVMLALMRLEGDTYGVPIFAELEASMDRRVSLASVYAALQRLESKGLVVSKIGEPTAERGGRAKRYFRVTAKGLREARTTQRALMRLWSGVKGLQNKLA